MSCCHVARSSATDCARRRPPSASHSPRRNQIALSPAAAAAPSPPRHPVVHREEHPRPVRRHPVHVRGDRHGQATAELLGRQQPASTARAGPTRAGPAPTPHARTRRRRPPSRPARYDTAWPSRSSMACSAPRPDRRHRHRHRHRCPRPPAPEARPGPTRYSIPWRSGGNDPSMGKGGDCFREPRSEHHAADQPTCVWQHQRHAHAFGGPRLPRPDPPGDRPRPAQAAGRPERPHHPLRRLRPERRQPPRGQPPPALHAAPLPGWRATGPSPSPAGAPA